VDIQGEIQFTVNDDDNDHEELGGAHFIEEKTKKTKGRG
jgi:hypothetical protein